MYLFCNWVPFLGNPTNSIEPFSVPATMSSNATTCLSPGHAVLGAYNGLRIRQPRSILRSTCFRSCAPFDPYHFFFF